MLQRMNILNRNVRTLFRAFFIHNTKPIIIYLYQSEQMENNLNEVFSDPNGQKMPGSD